MLIYSLRADVQADLVRQRRKAERHASTRIARLSVKRLMLTKLLDKDMASKLGSPSAGYSTGHAGGTLSQLRLALRRDIERASA